MTDVQLLLLCLKIYKRRLEYKDFGSSTRISVRVQGFQFEYKDFSSFRRISWHLLAGTCVSLSRPFPHGATPLFHHLSAEYHLNPISPQHHHPSPCVPSPNPRNSDTGIGSNNHTPPAAKSAHSKSAV
jgi:hypothetical protein